MYKLSLENEWNNEILMTQNESKWQITNITGLNSPPAVISSSVVSGFDGSRFNTSRLDNRNVVISFVINGNVERNRIELNSVIMPKRYIKVKYKNHLKDLYIEGYVESFEYDVFSSKVSGQISILCTNPYWIESVSSVVKCSSVVNLFEFPFSIPEEGIALSEMVESRQTNFVQNNGNVETGVLISIEARHNIIQPTITNVSTGESITIEEELQPSDRILISTLRGKKYIKKDCNCVESNLINKMTDDSKWIRLITGQNIFAFSALYGTENMDLTITHTNLYGGV